MTQIYIIRMVKHPEEKPICLNQKQYDDFIKVVDSCNMESYESECFKIATVETLNGVYYYDTKILTCEEAIKVTSLAMHIHITSLKDSIRLNILK